jgi:hypothetical protein
MMTDTMRISLRRALLIALTVAFLGLQGCASSDTYKGDDDPRNDPNQYWERQPGFTPFSA